MNDVPKQIPYKRDHFDFIELREQERVDIPIETLEYIATAGQCASMMFDGRILCIFGYMELHPGVMYVVVIPSIWIGHSLSYKKAFIRQIHRYLKQLREMPMFHRMESNSIADDLHDSFMRHLGFKCEGTLEKYSSNKVDYRKWAWVRN